MIQSIFTRRFLAVAAVAMLGFAGRAARRNRFFTTLPQCMYNRRRRLHPGRALPIVAVARSQIAEPFPLLLIG